MAALPPPAGPRNIRELFYYVRRWLGGLTGDFNTHEADKTNPHEVMHDQLTDVTADQHHNQVHDLYGADQGDVFVDTAPELRDLLAFNGTKFSRDRRMNYIFNGYVGGVTYEKDDVINDNGFLAIAINQTTERPSPVPTGPSALALNELDLNWQVSQDVGTNIVTGQRYSSSNTDVFIDIVRFYIPVADTDIWYRAAARVYNDPLFPTDHVSDWIQGGVVGWIEADITPEYVQTGVTFEVYLQTENRAGNTTSVVSYNYTSSNIDYTPLAGEMHRRNNRTYVWINKTTAAGILDVPPVAGTQITTGVSDWNIGSVSDEITYWDCELVGPIGNPVDGLTEFTFQSPAAVSNQFYYENLDYWTTNPPTYATVEGILALDGFPIYNDDAYGINIQYTPVVLSNDWELMSTPAGGGGSSSGSFTPEIFTGAGEGSGYVPDQGGNKDKRVLFATGDWGFQDENIDGGAPDSVYLADQVVDGGVP